MTRAAEKFEYVEHMLAEHQRLDQLIRRTVAAVPNWEEMDSQDWLPHMLSGLVAIRTELVHHFRNEEQGGCLEEAVARRPELSGEVQRIEGEHDEILARMSDLIDRCQCRGQLAPQKAMAIQQELRQIVRELRVHEAAEERVMQQGFSVSLKSEDVSAKVEVEPVAGPRGRLEKV